MWGDLKATPSISKSSARMPDAQWTQEIVPPSTPSLNENRKFLINHFRPFHPLQASVLT